MWIIPRYREDVSREWNQWLEFWSDTFLRVYYPELEKVQ